VTLYEQCHSTKHGTTEIQVRLQGTLHQYLTSVANFLPSHNYT